MNNNITTHVVVEVVDREIVVHRCKSLEEAQNLVKKSYWEVYENCNMKDEADDMCYISDDCMVAYICYVDTVFDWQVEEVNCVESV